jgi:prepilin-type N-terminal cleavage/methylation domain-containing protein
MQTLLKQKGFSLVELMIVVAIIAILAASGWQVLRSSQPNMRMRSAARDIYSAMTLAKTEAIRRGENVTLLFGVAPAPVSFTLFLDNGAGGGVANNEIVDGTEGTLGVNTLLVSDPSLADRVRFASTQPQSAVVVAPDGVSFANDALVFTPRGIPVHAVNGGLGMGGVGLRFLPVSGNPQYWRALTVSSAGRISMQ